MQQTIKNMLRADAGTAILPDTRLSFKPFLEFVRLRLQDKNCINKEVLNFLLDKFKAFPELEGEVALDQLPAYTGLLDLLYVALTSVAEDENKICWGLCVPMTPLIFYGSTPFYNLLNEADAHDCKCDLEDTEYKAFIKTKYENFYAYILRHFYGIRFGSQGKLIRSITDPHTNLTRHFSLNLNTDFVEVTANVELPRIDIEMMRNYAMAEDAVGILQKVLPMDMFAFSGFTVMTITDVTPQYALEAIRDNIVKNKNNVDNRGFPLVVQSLKELVGSNDVEFNILPLFKINGKLVENIEDYCQSILFTTADNDEATCTRCFSMVENFISSPKLIYYTDLDAEASLHGEVGKILLAAGVKSFALFPVFYNKKLVGAIEVYSRQKGLLNEKILSSLELAKDLVAQLIQNSLTSFEEEIEAVIKEKFTSLQPSVQWKFNEVAWHYLQKKNDKTGKRDPEEISFENVYPIYGAVDVRNSTIERNAALHKDLRIQFDVLDRVLNNLKNKTGFGLLDEKIFAVEQWSGMLNADASLFNQEVKLNDFLDNDIMAFLVKFADKQPELHVIAEEYFKAIDSTAGIAHQNRRQLESSMTTVISSVNNYFELLKDEIQLAYPCYFEKFRTDGIEYDIYIGQSITPTRPYSDIYLKNLRLIQLSSMAAITKYTHAMLPNLATPVQTTQLIFIHSHPIDIRFRRDEKRFDVEGAYNIRYHIIKKRIDKVQLKNSGERLTQPNKIALVYFSVKEAEEYIAYIRYLQGSKMLLDDLEWLDLEELQGVSGLKALRVGVNLD